VIQVDACFAIGKTHKVCQDYALAGKTANDRSFAVVCDGCSSSPDTDFGARLLTRAAVQHLSTFGEGFDSERAAWLADGWRTALNLPSTALDATLMAAFETDDKQVRIIVAGDGVVAARRRDTGLYDYWAVRYPSGAPGYLTYLLDPERKKAFLDQTQGMRAIEVSWGIPDAPERPPPTAFGWDEGDNGPVWTLDRDPAVYDLVVVMSDGVESFQRPAGTRLESIPLREVLDQVMSVKGGTGEFLTRRLNRFLTKFCTQNGWQHYDDFAVAGLFLDPPETTDE